MITDLLELSILGAIHESDYLKKICKQHGKDIKYLKILIEYYALNPKQILSEIIPVRNIPWIKYLNSIGTNLNVQNFSTGDTLFHVAVKNNDIRLIYFLIDNGGINNLRNDKGLTAIDCTTTRAGNELKKFIEKKIFEKLKFPTCPICYMNFDYSNMPEICCNTCKHGYDQLCYSKIEKCAICRTLF